MTYIRLKLWFAVRVAFFSAVISFPTLASAMPQITLATFATFGIPIGILAYHYFYKQERFVFQNLGIRKRELYLFASVFIWIITIPLWALVTLIYG
ncbi:hypothetical protein [Nonlabens agnitus]|uniref:Uncharacterized protein n=1 Tax=Nonlabens agnitus TaxID=870484 RepID=A0A2S9WWS7_9FLAO|nr:hypothetical protein [Nonlabens agnitus]PRP67836.1 hypothetical protein BST86_12390 [Nonlabens agnitus]